MYPPTLPTGCTAAVSVASTSGTQRAFTLSLTGDAGAEAQTATATVAGETVTASGNLVVTVTSETLMGASPKAYAVPVLLGDTLAAVAAKIAAAFAADAALMSNYTVANPTAEEVMLTSTNPLTTDETLNIAMTGSLGIETAATSVSDTVMLGSWTSPAIQAWQPMFPPRFTTMGPGSIFPPG